MKTQISREHGDRGWTLPELMDSIYKEIEANQAGEEQGKYLDFAIHCNIFS